MKPASSTFLPDARSFLFFRAATRGPFKRLHRRQAACITIVATQYWYRRPPRKRQAAALEVPAVVKAANPAKASKRARSAKLVASAATVAAPDVAPSGDRVAPPSAIITIGRRKHAMLAHLLENLTPEELQRRGDAAEALFREVVRRINRRP
jgi:hypothetical protein